jgi:hypothetical protein
MGGIDSAVGSVTLIRGEDDGEYLPAVRSLSRCPIIGVDLEGFHLGERGETSLLQASAPRDNSNTCDVFLFDLLGAKSVGAPLEALLSGKLPTAETESGKYVSSSTTPAATRRHSGSSA